MVFIRLQNELSSLTGPEEVFIRLQNELSSLTGPEDGIHKAAE